MGPIIWRTHVSADGKLDLTATTRGGQTAATTELLGRAPRRGVGWAPRPLDVE